MVWPHSAPHCPSPAPITMTHPQNYWIATSFLPFHHMPHLLAHASPSRSSQLPQGSPGDTGQLSSSVVTSGPWLFPHVSWSLPFPRLLLGVESLAWSSCPAHATEPHSKQIKALETIAPRRHEPPNICKQPDWLVPQDFCKICFHLPYSGSCPRASR